MGKAKLTRRQQRQYHAIIGGDGSAWAYPGPGYWGSVNGQRRNGRAYGNGWCALTFARQFGGRSDVDLKRLQLEVLRSGNSECAYEFARDVPGANVRRLQRVVVEDGDPSVMRAFAMNVPGADVRHLEAMILIAEVMST